MLWTLVVLTTTGNPIYTGLVYPTLGACYAAEDQMAQEYVDHFNARLKNGLSQEDRLFLQSRLLRGVCVPQEKPS